MVPMACTLRVILQVNDVKHLGPVTVQCVKHETIQLRLSWSAAVAGVVSGLTPAVGATPASPGPAAATLMLHNPVSTCLITLSVSQHAILNLKQFG
jgi:hypothetical protein